MLLYRVWLAISVILILAGTAWIAAGESATPYFEYSLIALVAFGLDLADGSTMGFVFIILALPHLNWHETVLLCASATFIHAVTRPDRADPRVLLRSLCSTTFAVIASQAAFHATSLTHLSSPVRLMFASGVCFAALHTPGWKKANLWSFPYYPVAGAITALFPVSIVLAPLLILTWWSYRLYERRLWQQMNQSIQADSLHLRTIETLALAIEAKDQPLPGRSRRVQIYAVEMAKELRLSKIEIEALRAASLLYDIGELAVPEHIILKPGPLTDEEYDKVKIHPSVAAEILEQVKFPYPVAPIVLAHHERWDGTGYPRGLKGEEIPIGARILAIVDALDALASPRLHRPAMDLRDALARVVAESGRAFDPRLVALLRKRQPHWERLATQKPEDGFLGSIVSAQKESKILFDLTQKLASSLDLKETFAALMSALRQLVPSDTFVVWVVRENRLTAEYTAGDYHGLYAPLKIPLNSGVSGWTAAHRKSIINGNGLLDLAHAEEAPKLLSRIALSVPLCEPGLEGALTLYRTNEPFFTTEDARIVSTIAPKLALAVGNGLRFRRAADEAATDPLTGLPNAAALSARLGKSCFSGAVVVCDLDGFKLINDRFGHLAGNRLLESLAKGFRNSCREGDFIARMGGDEFVLLLEGIGPSEIAARLAQFRDMVRCTGREICCADVLDASFGAAFYPADGSTSEELIAAADRQMYRRKAEQRAGVLRIEQRRAWK